MSADVNAMQAALTAAGFTGIEAAAGVIYARLTPALPEFTATPEGAEWLLSQSWPLRATEAQVAAWTALHPDAPMDIHLGETRIRFRAPPEGLPQWAALVEAMVAKCVAWRRGTRQRDEGM